MRLHRSSHSRGAPDLKCHCRPSRRLRCTSPLHVPSLRCDPRPDLDAKSFGDARWDRTAVLKRRLLGVPCVQSLRTRPTTPKRKRIKGKSFAGTLKTERVLLVFFSVIHCLKRKKFLCLITGSFLVKARFPIRCFMTPPFFGCVYLCMPCFSSSLVKAYQCDFT